ncbi:MAG: NapC/NirT family cytochrome c [Acidobacteriota bacterium]|nr:NapC/NirT family cytochrome c [Acidobacteriota bacterium]
MKRLFILGLLMIVCGASVNAQKAQKSSHSKEPSTFRTSDRCFPCHTGMTTESGTDVSIGFDWRASIMANSARDPYWQASIRRESIDHPESIKSIEDECTVCHMPIPRFEAKLHGEKGLAFSRLPINTEDDPAAADGVTCSVCHQIAKDNLGTRESFNGNFVIHAPDKDGLHTEYGPFPIESGQTRIMWSSTEGYLPQGSDHIRRSELCATCHTLITTALGEGGNAIGTLPEQVPYQEWLHSDYRNKQSCQDCHMPLVQEPTQISKVFGVKREGLHRHQFVAANFFMQEMLNRYRDDLSVVALPHELTRAADETVQYLQSKAATLAVENISMNAGRLQADVVVRNHGGHKLPTAYPSRRAWLHLSVRDHSGKLVFESGALQPNGSIAGNDNDDDPKRFEPHYSEIRTSDQVQIYESILGDEHGRVTTGLLAGVGYLKDNRLLPDGFDKQTADKEIAVIGAAHDDPNFSAGSDRVHYSVEVDSGAGPFTVDAELLYQPIGFRWANNLKPYSAAVEPHRFTTYYEAMQAKTAVRLAQAFAAQ